MSIEFNFEGKVALITGSSDGIGAATALLFSKSGAKVVVTGRNTENVRKVAKQCREASSNDKVLEVLADVTKEEDLKRLIDETISTFGRLDILVNNAGIALMAIIDDSDYMQKYNKIIQTNLNSMVLLTHLSVKHLEKTKGNIINVSSNASLRSIRSFSPYFISKAAMDMFTRCMAAELGPKGIRVNVVNPGVVRSSFGITMGLDKEDMDLYWESYAERLPMGRVGDGVDTANAILFLATNESSFITGSSLLSDGGQLAANIPFQ